MSVDLTICLVRSETEGLTFRNSFVDAPLFFSFVAAAFLLVAPIEAQTTATTDPAGFTTTSCLGNSDTFVSLPFTRAPEFVGAIAGASGNTIDISGATGWTANQFVYNGTSQRNRYYALIGSGGAAKEGHIFNVTGNSTTALTVDTSIDSLSNIPNNAQVLVIPHWTLATVFPATDANISFTPTASTASYKSQILPNFAFPGSNLPASPTYYFDDNAASKKWRRVNDNGPDYGDDVLAPGNYFVIRNANGAPTLPLTGVGSVLTKKLALSLRTSASQAQDNAVGMVRPFDVTLNASGLNPADGSFAANDQLLLFDNTQVAINKTPSATYYYDVQANNTGGWRLTGDPVTDRGNDVIPAGSGMVVRKALKAGAPTMFWTNSLPVYPFKAVSRKSHGAGVFDINLPLAGNLGVECRNGGPAQIVLSFPVAVTFTTAAVTSGAGGVGTTSGSGTTTLTVNLTGVTNAQKIMLSLPGVTNGTFTNDVVVPIGVLAGDTTGNGSVNASDVSQTKSQSGQGVTASNFRTDVTLSNSINSSDVSFVKSKSGTAIPP